jgi:hypothetical protein
LGVKKDGQLSAACMHDMVSGAAQQSPLWFGRIECIRALSGISSLLQPLQTDYEQQVPSCKDCQGQAFQIATMHGVAHMCGPADRT